MGPGVALDPRVVVAVEDDIPLVDAEQRQTEVEEGTEPAVLVRVAQLVLVQRLRSGDADPPLVGGRQDVAGSSVVGVVLPAAVDEEDVAEGDAEKRRKRPQPAATEHEGEGVEPPGGGDVEPEWFPADVAEGHDPGQPAQDLTDQARDLEDEPRQRVRQGPDRPEQAQQDGADRPVAVRVDTVDRIVAAVHVAVAQPGTPQPLVEVLGPGQRLPPAGEHRVDDALVVGPTRPTVWNQEAAQRRCVPARAEMVQLDLGDVASSAEAGAGRVAQGQPERIVGMMGDDTGGDVGLQQAGAPAVVVEEANPSFVQRAVERAVDLGDDAERGAEHQPHRPSGGVGDGEQFVIRTVQVAACTACQADDGGSALVVVVQVGDDGAVAADLDEMAGGVVAPRPITAGVAVPGQSLLRVAGHGPGPRSGGDPDQPVAAVPVRDLVERRGGFAMAAAGDVAERVVAEAPYPRRLGGGREAALRVVGVAALAVVDDAAGGVIAVVATEQLDAAPPDRPHERPAIDAVRTRLVDDAVGEVDARDPRGVVIGKAGEDAVADPQRLRAPAGVPGVADRFLAARQVHFDEPAVVVVGEAGP